MDKFPLTAKYKKNDKEINAFLKEEKNIIIGNTNWVSHLILEELLNTKKRILNPKQHENMDAQYFMKEIVYGKYKDLRMFLNKDKKEE